MDGDILNSLQEGVPLNPRPFRTLAEGIGVKEEYLLKRARALKYKGVIRNVAAHVNHRMLGFKSTLIALRVRPSRIEYMTGWLIKYPEVTHCYLRRGEYNLWLVFISSDGEKIRNFIKRLAKEAGGEKILNLFRRFKINLWKSLLKIRNLKIRNWLKLLNLF